MQLIRHLPAHSDAPTAVAIGNFDGLHRGHQAVIDTMRRVAEAEEIVPSALTFEPHPRRLFTPHAPAFRLEPLRVKLARLREVGAQRVYMPRFNAAFASLSAEAFLEMVLQQSLGARAVVTGENFAFGKGRGGDVAMLRHWGAAHDITILTVPPVTVGGIICSSSAVRSALKVGDMAQAAQLLGRTYSIQGRVIHGDGRGQKIGFPTANIALLPQLKLPAHGVYAVRVGVEGSWLPAVANLGMRPTVGHQPMPSLEVHLFDLARDLYGMRLEIAFVAQLREEKKFDSLAALTAQIAQDCVQAKTALSVAV
jgi:riboflavin kinase/FMN adenylyltransferase